MQPISHKWKTRRSRYGVTILEVLFATAVVIVGMMGIASVFAVAGRRASESARAAESQALAQHWFGEALARGANNSTLWQGFDETAPARYTVTKTVASSRPGKGALFLPNTLLRELGTESVCLDPAFMAGRDVGNTPTSSGWIRPCVFPYFHDRTNPLSDPALGSSGTAWEDQPRMTRVTSFSAAKALEKVFSSQDELNLDLDDGDKSIRPTRSPQFYYPFKLDDASYANPPAWQPTMPAKAIPIAKTSTAQAYSWFATMSPAETIQASSQPINTSAKSLYTMSLVVLYHRDYAVFDPSTPTPRNAAESARIENGLQGERISWVWPMSGDFDGGHGGRVQLICSDGTDPEIFVGSWIMLSKYIDIDAAASVPPLPSFRGCSVNRWYRVVAIDSDAKLAPIGVASAPTTDPYGNTPPNQVWSRNVVLDGPDWSFSPSVVVQTSSGPVTVMTPTTATIVKGAVNVIERIVEVR
ncbi:MAG: hypothetical protein U0892_15955 [Pirellulales bacterium]